MGAKMFNKLSIFSIGIIFILIISTLGCVNDEERLFISYWAYYDDTLDLNEIDQVFLLHNISSENNGDVITFYINEEIENNSIAKTHGWIWKESWTSKSKSNNYNSELNIVLDDNEYPNLKKTGDYKDKLDSRKPLLENSMNYIVDLIYNVSGKLPDKKDFTYEDTF